ncbi:MAG: hypothetical protein NT167_07360, partial [Verrucomicrobia bacterium]|nr:hypothetical protein [Verrucomicrobiota bacterium]
WLMTKEIRFRGDWQYKNPAKVEPSGWVFEFENKWNPDVDDTAMVLLALRKAEQWMLERFEGSDGLAAIFPGILYSLIALKALGYPDDHPQIVRAEREFKRLAHETEQSVRIEPCLSPVWDTAIVSMCLQESGVTGDHPAIKRATEWLG